MKGRLRSTPAGGVVQWRSTKFANKVVDIAHLGEVPGSYACYSSGVKNQGRVHEPRPTERGLAMATAAPGQPDAPHQGVLARHPLTFYFLLAYAGTWLVTVPVALSANGIGLLPFGIPEGSVIFVSAAWVFLGPTLAALIMTGATEGRAGIRRLLRRYVLWRVGLRWYLVVLLGPPVIVLLATVVLPGALASFKTLAPLHPLLLLVSFPLILIFGGALFEEGGWRGFALPRLQRLHDPLVGTLILTPLWACWHLPLFWVTVWGTPPHHSQHGSIPCHRDLHDHSLYVGLQQYGRQHTPRHFAAHVP